MSDTEDDTQHRRYGLEIGVVVDVNDPKGLGRIRARIPGLHEPAGPWARQIGAFAGGGPSGGAFGVPPLNHEVAIFFKNGDPDHPYYMPGNYGAPQGKPRETPTPVRDLPANEVPKVVAFEWGRYVVVIDDREGHRALLLRDKRTEDELHHDGENGIWRLKGTSGIFIECDGRVQIEGATVVVNGRPVREGPEPL